MTKTMDIDLNNEELIHTKTVFRRHSKGSVMFNGCSPLGDVIIIDNISQTKSFDLVGWYIERQTNNHPMIQYTFKDSFVLPPLTTIELWSNTDISKSMLNDLKSNQSSEPNEQQQQQDSLIIINTKLQTWNAAEQWSITRLFDNNGREKATFSHRTLTPIEQEKYE